MLELVVRTVAFMSPRTTGMGHTKSMATTENGLSSVPTTSGENPVPLTRRQLRELEMQQQDTSVVEDEFTSLPVVAEEDDTSVNDTGLPSLFGDDESTKKKKVEAPVEPAPYAREAPAAKFLDRPEVKRIPMRPAEPRYDAPPRAYTPPFSRAVDARAEWTSSQKTKVLAFSALYFALIGGIVFGTFSMFFSLAGPALQSM